ncbi:MAG: tetratricopeptide repeat protein, partial [Planctomycetes bacterium]|nr:tetratricopeptide repeat protein [Planctomycetota bacterium]
RGLVVAVTAVFVVLTGGIVGTGLGLESALDANEQLEVQRKIAVGKTADAERSLERATEVKRVLVEMLALTNPIFAQGRDTSLLRMVLDRTAERLFDGSIVDPVTRGELHAIVADVYFNLAAWDDARRHFRALIDLGTAAVAPPELGPASEPILDAMLELARIEIMTGDASRATECFEAARLAIRDALPPSHPLTIELGLREVELLDRTASPDAIDKARDVVANARTHLGVGSRLTLEAMQTLASFESRSGHPDTANALMLEVEAGQAARYGPESAPVQLARAARLSILEQQGNAEEALELARQMHAAFTKAFGADSPRTQAVEGAIGRQLANLGRSDEAIPILERYFALEQQMIGSHRALRMRTPSILVLSYSEVGRTEAALELAQRVVESMTEAYGADDDTTLMNRANVGALLHALGRDADAEGVLVDVRDRAIRANGADSGAAIQALLSLRPVFHALGKLDEACAAGEAYVAARRRTSGEDHPLTRAAIEDLIHAYEAAGRNADAKRLRDG